jgi:hypothetical protein
VIVPAVPTVAVFISIVVVSAAFAASPDPSIVNTPVVLEAAAVDIFIELLPFKVSEVADAAESAFTVIVGIA